MPFPGFGEVAEKLRRSTVHIRAGRHGHGSGIIVSRDGLIVTNAHVANGRATGPHGLQVELWDATAAAATISWRDPAHDLALLRVKVRDLPAATLADSDCLQAGQPVIAIGNPWGFRGALTTGVIHALGRVPGAGPMKWIQSDAHLAPGNSGGPLADARGHVIGVNTMVASGVGLAVPSNTVARLMRGPVAKAPLGIVARPVELNINGENRLGILALELLKDGAAQAASLMQGDIVIGVDGRKLESIEDFERALEADSERVVRFQFVRGDRAKIRTVAVRLGVGSVAAA